MLKSNIIMGLIEGSKKGEDCVCMWVARGVLGLEDKFYYESTQ